MRIPFTCAFIELLASYDNTNQYSYLLIFFQQDIKHVGVCGSSANFSQKTFLEKIIQNKVCICQRGSQDQLYMFESEFFLTISHVFRKTRCSIRLRSLISSRLLTSLKSFSLVTLFLTV